MSVQQRVRANGEDSERSEAHGIAGMIARVEELEAEPTPIFDRVLEQRAVAWDMQRRLHEAMEALYPGFWD